jgi:hypothetical protein
VSSGVRIFPDVVCEVERGDPQTNKSSGGTVGPAGVGAKVGLLVLSFDPDVGAHVGHASVGAYVGTVGFGFGLVGTTGVNVDGGGVVGNDPFVGS